MTNHHTEQPTVDKCDTLIASVDSLRSLTHIQCADGNWNYDSYMHGMANGLILALSLFEQGGPEFLTAPKEWLSDRITNGPERVEETEGLL